MITTARLGRLALNLLAASLLLGVGGCAGQQPARVEAPQLSSADLPKAPPKAVFVIASPGLSVSEELSRACRLSLNDPESAPKFDFDESTLADADGTVLAQIARCVTTGPLAGKPLDLVGRADPRGEVEYNLALGARRANRVREYLSSLGVSESTLHHTSRGELDATGEDEDGWRRDRRVDILLH